MHCMLLLIILSPVIVVSVSPMARSWVDVLSADSSPLLAEKEGEAVFFHPPISSGRERRSDLLFTNYQGVDHGTHVWKVLLCGKGIDENSISYSIGITSVDMFGPGYKNKGYFFNGFNLHDGSSLAAGGYGVSHVMGTGSLSFFRTPRLVDQCAPNGPVENLLVALKIVKESKTAQVFFVQNGTPLGLAFAIPNAPLPLYLMISFGGSGIVEKVDVSAMDDLWDRRDPEAERGSCLGSFKVVKATNDDWIGIPFSIKPDVMIEGAEKDDGTKNSRVLSLNYYVVNNMRMALICDGSEDGPMKCRSGLIMSTRKAGPPEEMKKEQQLNAILGESPLEVEHPDADSVILKVKGQEIVLFREPVKFEPVLSIFQ